MPDLRDETPIDKAVVDRALMTPEVPAKARASAVLALSQAWDDTLEFLFKPLDVGRWLWLSFVCLLLGGGASAAAFNWSLGSLPGDVGFDRVLGPLRQYAFEHPWLIILAVTLGLSLGLGILYLRAVFRFVLVDALVRRDVRPMLAWVENRPLGRSYFRWLLATLVLVGAALTLGAIAVFPHLRSMVSTGIRSVAFWAILTALLLVDVLVGLLLALVIALTDDLVVPIMFAEGLTLLPAWKRLWASLRAEAGGFAVYVVLRFAVAVAVGAAALFFLFPILLGLFSGAIITGVLIVLGLRLLGLAWAWNSLTTALASAALLLLSGLILIFLSVVGMPGQVLIQNLGIRFISARIPSLEAMLPAGREKQGTRSGLDYRFFWFFVLGPLSLVLSSHSSLSC